MSDKFDKDPNDPKREFFESLGQLVFWGCAAGVLLFLIYVFL